MFTSNYHDISVGEMKRACKLLYQVVYHDCRLVAYKENSGTKIILVKDGDLEEYYASLQPEFDKVCEMFDPHLPIFSMCEYNLEMKEEVKGLLYRKWFNERGTMK